MTLNPSKVQDLAKALKEARAKNRQIVPIVGAGLSADSGFPIITAVVRYFGKLYRYIESGGPIKQTVKVRFVEDLFKKYKNEPWKFVEHFGWPDRFQLNQDLFWQNHAQKRGDIDSVTNPITTADDLEGIKLIETAMIDGLEALLRTLSLNPQGLRAFDSLKKDIENRLPEAEFPEKLKTIQRRFKQDWSKSIPFELLGDWRRLILYFTDFQSDYADALFARFGATRKPGQGHQFLAFLAKYLAVPTIFTFNFDSLIEQALEGEGIRVKEFAMERGAGLPSASLLRSDRVAVIKMHGSTHALLVDEQLDRPLRSDYLERFDRLTGQDPLLLVVGCSQNDRRLRDLVSRVLDKPNADSDVMKSSPRVLWLYYEREPPPFLQDLVSEQKVKPASVRVCETNNPGATLLHLHSWLTNCNPASRVSYLAHVQQPIYRDRATEDFGKKRFELISTNHPNPMPTAAQALLVRANYWARNEYHFIWIDLEAVHTLAGVVGSIIDQCRRFDPDLAPSVLPLDIDHVEHRDDDDSVDKTIGLAVKRVARALRRARYYVAFDGLEAYAYPATTHHGLTHLAITSGAAARLKSLVTFLMRLKELTDQGKGLSESLIGVSVDALKCRFEDTEAHHGLASCISLDKLCEDLEAEKRYEVVPVANETNHEFNLTFEPLGENLPLLTFKRNPRRLRSIFTTQTSHDHEDQCKTRLALILLNLSFFRRTRPLVAMRHLLEPLLPSRKANDKSHIDKLLMKLSQTQNDGVQEYYLLRQLEGGGFWFNHTVRDYLYSQNTKYTNTPHVGKCLDGKSPPETRATFCRSAAFQLFISAMAHQRIARTWNTYTYVQSQDTFAFLEYTYHQISSVRSLAKLRGLLQVAINTRPDAGAEIIAKAILQGIAACGELARRMAKDPNDREAAVETFRQLEFETGIEPYAGIEEDSDADDASPRDELVNCLEDLLCHGVERTLKDKNFTSVAERVELFLKRRHRRELRGLYRAWTRAEVTLRTKVAAEQLLHWCDELLKDDLKYRCNTVVIRYDRDLSKEKDACAPFFVPICYSPFRDGDFIDFKLKGIIEKFRRLLQDLRVKLWIERSDYLACIKARFEELRHEPDGELATYGLYEFPLSLTASADELKCHKLLDVVDSQLKSNQESSYGDDGLIAGCDVALRNLEKIESRLKKLDKEMSERERELDKKQGVTTVKPSSADFPQDQANLNEAWLRLFHLRAECQLGRVSMFSHDGFTGDHQQNGIDKWVPEVAVDRLNSAKRAIDKGLKELTERDARTRYTPRSVVVDPTADGALYLQYRSLFYMLNGRRRWLDTGNDIDRAFAAALWSFEMARGGLGDHNPLVTALIELYTVEALLARSRYVLFKDAENQPGHGAPRPPAHENAIELAEGWYGSARAGLQRANELLLAGRRNVIWRKFYFRLATQYHCDRLLLNYTILEKSKNSAPPGKDKRMSTGEIKRRESDHKQRASDVEEHRLGWERSLRTSPIRLRRGYQSLLTALDLYLPASSSQNGQSRLSEHDEKPPNRYRWLYRMWWELTLSGYAIGRLAVDLLDQARPDEVRADQVDNMDYVCEELRWLNEMDGIADSELQEFVNPCYQTLSSHYDALQNIFGESAQETALLRRSKILKQALAGLQT